MRQFKTCPRLLLDRSGEREDLGDAENVGNQQDDEDDEERAYQRAAGVGAGGQLVDALGELRRFLIGQRGDARLDLGRIHAARLELRLQVAALEEGRDARAR